jgi:hypothetical protein
LKFNKEKYNSAPQECSGGGIWGEFFLDFWAKQIPKLHLIRTLLLGEKTVRTAEGGAEPNPEFIDENGRNSVVVASQRPPLVLLQNRLVRFRCPKRGSNPHARCAMALNHVCIPIPPSGHL